MTPGSKRPDYWGPRLAFVVVCLVAVALEARFLLTKSVRVRAAGRETYVVSHFSEGLPVGQTFRALSDGLQRVEIEFWADRPATIQITCRVLGWSDFALDHWAALYDWRATVSLPQGTSWQRFDFKPILESNAGIYQFQVQQIAVEGGGGSRPIVGPMASRDNSFKDGNLIIGRTQVAGEGLLFAAHGADTLFAWWQLHGGSQLPKELRSTTVQVALLAVYHLLLASFAYYLVIVAPEESRP